MRDAGLYWRPVYCLCSERLSHSLLADPTARAKSQSVGLDCVPEA